MRKNVMLVALLALTAMLVLTACGPKPTTVAPATQPPATQPPATEPPAVQEFTFGIVMVGAHNDHGWTQAHYDAGLYVEQKVPGAKMLYIENVYTGSPVLTGTTTAQLAEQLVAQGANWSSSTRMT
jgi:simple sugar transport system substrate-binding protein